MRLKRLKRQTRQIDRYIDRQIHRQAGRYIVSWVDEEGNVTQIHDQDRCRQKDNDSQARRSTQVKIDQDKTKKDRQIDRYPQVIQEETLQIDRQLGKGRIDRQIDRQIDR